MSRGLRGTLLPLALLLCFVAGCERSPSGDGAKGSPAEKTSGESVSVDVNSRAPAFAAQSVDGRPVRLADYIGTHVVLLEFWGIFCKSCIEEMPHIEELHRRYASRGFQVISVNTDVFSAKRVSAFLERNGIHPAYPIVRDPRQEIVGAYKVEILPVTVIVDRSGWIRLYQEGYRPGDEDRFDSKIRKLLGKSEEEDVTLASRGGVTVFAPSGAALAEKGKAVAGLTSRTLGGEEVVLGKGRCSLLVFWSLFCKPCREEMPQVEALAARHRGAGLDTYTVNVDSDRLLPRVARFAGERPSLPCLADGTEAEGKGALAKALGVRVTPTHVLLDGDGTVLYAAAGSTDIAALEAKIVDSAKPKAQAAGPRRKAAKGAKGAKR